MANENDRFNDQPKNNEDLNRKRAQDQAPARNDQGQDEGEEDAGRDQHPMPDQPKGEVRQGTDGRRYHYSNADQTHVAPKQTVAEIESKTGRKDLKNPSAQNK